VEEAISNAIRHGHASRVAVSVSQGESGGLSIGILDNGRGPKGGSQGMGSAYLAMVSEGRWTMEWSGSGTRVMVPVG
jgi:anti-sigma regulatory factor (Ser/Thr protein kinase)